jgi:hypothetical protein
MLKVLSDSGKQVILVMQAPLPETHIRSHVRKSVVGYNSSVYGRTLEDWNKIYAAKSQLLKELPLSVSVLDPSEKFCKDSRCLVVKNGHALYFDDDHISVDGARFLSGEVLKMLKISKN